MNKMELVAAVAAEAGLTKAQAQKAVEATVNAIAGALKNGEKVQLIGFGTFSVSQKAARKGVNPATGATIEMICRFYNVDVKTLDANDEKYPVTCGVFGMEKIMDEIAKTKNVNPAVAKYIHGIAFNAWNFAKKPEKIYLSGGFCENNCLVDSLKNYCEVELLGRFVLCEGLIPS